MKTQEIISKLSAWTIQHSNDQYARVVSPCTFGEDGLCIAFTVVFPTPNTFALTDHMEHWLQSAQFGAKWDKNKQQYLNQTHGIRFAQFNDDGEITAQGELSLLNAALSDALKLALALSFKFPKWLPKFNLRMIGG